MAKKTRRSINIDQATQMLLAKADVAAMRPALAVAPELVIQTLMRERRPVTAAKKKTVRKTAAKKARKAAPARKTTGKKAKNVKKTRKAKKTARKK